MASIRHDLPTVRIACFLLLVKTLLTGLLKLFSFAFCWRPSSWLSNYCALSNL